MNHPNPQPIWQVMTGYQHSAAFKTAIDLELFTKIAEGNKTVESLSKACGAAERGIRIFGGRVYRSRFPDKGRRRIRAFRNGGGLSR
ncbi:MAG TPA: hypothetical protein VK612_04375 [Pyrinomonadaceae bacterium]|nr:hypothetical protein [Pyrinomonadaceae bacterium]